MTIGAPPRNQQSFEFRKWLESLTRYVNSIHSGSASSGGFVEVTIVGTKNGVNKNYTLSQEITEPALFFINGNRISPTHYTIAGTTLVIGASIPAPISTTELQLLGTPV